jgi:hypothetical protein
MRYVNSGLSAAKIIQRAFRPNLSPDSGFDKEKVRERGFRRIAMDSHDISNDAMRGAGVLRRRVAPGVATWFASLLALRARPVILA